MAAWLAFLGLLLLLLGRRNHLLLGLLWLGKIVHLGLLASVLLSKRASETKELGTSADEGAADTPQAKRPSLLGQLFGRKSTDAGSPSSEKPRSDDHLDIHEA